MSLLPGRILPQTEPFGTLDEDGKTVIIEKNWWLWAYNVSLQSLGTGNGIPADQLIDLESVDIDSVGTDATALRAPLAALANLIPTDSDPVPSLQDVRNALLLAYSALDAVDSLVSGFAAPTAKVGLTTIAGTASTAMRSDAAPPIDQTIAPTWTGAHTFSPSAAVAITVNAPASQFGLTINGSASAGNSFALNVAAGTSGLDYAVNIVNQANTKAMFRLLGDMSWRLGNNGAGGNVTSMAGTSAGNVSINSPSSGDTLTLGPSATTGALIATSAALTTGAGAAAGTLTNAPSAGNPTKWIKINDNGTIRSVPAW